MMTMKEISELKKRPQYFNLFLECCEMLSLLEDRSAGRVIHAIADYFSDGTEPSQLNKKELRVFNRVQNDIDKSCTAWLAKVEGGKAGANERWRKGHS